MSLPIIILPPQKTATAPENIVRLAQAIKYQCNQYIMHLQSGPVTADVIFAPVQTIVTVIGELDRLRQTPGLDAMAQAQIPGYTGSMSADCQVTINAMQACVDWVIANVPKSSGFVLVLIWNADGTQSYRTFTTAQTAGLVAALQAVQASIG